MFSDDFAFAVPGSPSTESERSTSTSCSRSVSPFTTLAPPLLLPIPATSVTDLAAQLANQRIKRDSSICYDSCEAYANTDDDAGWTIPSPEDEFPQLDASIHKLSTIQRPRSPSRRAARQLNTRMLCSSTHRRDIAALVFRMVTQEDQCLITGPPSPTDSHEDEGYDSGVEASSSISKRSSSRQLHRPRMTQRHHSEVRTAAACVNKNVRHRSAHHRRPRSAGSS